MHNDIQLNLNADLNFEAVTYANAATTTKIRYSASGKKFVDIDRTTAVGHVSVTVVDESDHAATVNGEKIKGSINFSAEEIETPNGTRALLWNVYNFADRLEDDLDLEEIGSASIPDPIIDMLL